MADALLTLALLYFGWSIAPLIAIPLMERANERYWRRRRDAEPKRLLSDVLTDITSPYYGSASADEIRWLREQGL